LRTKPGSKKPLDSPTAPIARILAVTAIFLASTLFATVGRAYDLGPLGGVGGGPFRSPCRPDDALIGVQIKYGTALDSITAVCRPLNAERTQWAGETYMPTQACRKESPAKCGGLLLRQREDRLMLRKLVLIVLALPLLALGSSSALKASTETCPAAHARKSAGRSGIDASTRTKARQTTMRAVRSSGLVWRFARRTITARLATSST
jgi:hypothetical protein